MLESIGQIAGKAGLATSAIRYYEKIGLIPKPARASGHRRYDPAVLGRLRVIQLAQEAGYTIAEIQALLNAFPVSAKPSDRWKSLAPTKLAEIDSRIQNLRHMRMIIEQTIQCECETLEQCGEQSCA